MQNYQATPDYYRDYVEHGWLKDQAAKVHKYIKRWKNAAGKWVYQYKESKNKPESHTTYANWNEQRDWRAEGIYGNQNHKTAVLGAYIGRYGDISRARLNAKNKKVRSGTGYSGSSSYRKSGNLTSRGYSGSQGSGEAKRLRNVGTRKSVKSRVTKSTMTNKVRRGQAMGSSKKNSARRNPYSPTYKTKYSYTETMNKWGNGRQKGYPSAKKATSPNSATNRDILRREINKIRVTPKRYKKTTTVNYSKRKKQHRYA